jgi:hypothetical protein
MKMDQKKLRKRVQCEPSMSECLEVYEIFTCLKSRKSFLLWLKKHQPSNMAAPVITTEEKPVDPNPLLNQPSPSD